MMLQWDGITLGSSLSSGELRARNQLADRARAYDWRGLVELLAEDASARINASRPDGTSRYAPLHQVAHGGAPVDVAQRLVDMGAWRGLRTVRGERALDIALRRRHDHLRKVLSPRRVIEMPDQELRVIQEFFHEVIRARVARLVDEHRLRLPELEVLLEAPIAWFDVPGMYGGFTMNLAVEEGRAKLTTESWMRVVGGSGQRHVITVEGARLADEGFV